MAKKAKAGSKTNPKQPAPPTLPLAAELPLAEFDICSEFRFSADGRWLVGAHDRTLYVWNVASRRQVWRQRQHTGPVYGVCFSPGARVIASCGQRRVRGRDAGGEILFWKTGSGEVTVRLQVFDEQRGSDGPYGVQYTPDGKTVVCRLWSQIVLVDVRRRKERARLGTSASRIAVSPDGMHLAAFNHGTFELWNLKTAAKIHEGPARQHAAAPCYSPDGSYIVVGDRKAQVVELLDAATGKPRKTIPHNAKGDVTAFHFSPDGSRLFAAHPKGHVFAWETKTWHCLGHARGPMEFPEFEGPVAFSPDAAYYVNAGRAVRLWSLAELGF